MVDTEVKEKKNTLIKTKGLVSEYLSKFGISVTTSAEIRLSKLLKTMCLL